MLECTRPSEGEKRSSKKDKKMSASSKKASEIVEESINKKGQKRKQSGNEDPFKVPPNQFTKATLKAVEPFVVIDTSGVLPDYNKFKPRMDKEVITYVVKNAARKLVHVETQMRNDLTTELSIRPYHTALLQSIGSFAKVSQEEISRLNIKAAVNGDEEEEGENEVLRAFYLSSGGHAAVSLESRSTSSDEGFNIDHEVPPQGEDNVKAVGRTDFRIYNHDRSPFRLGLPQIKLDEVDTERLTVVAESKFLTENDAIFQACGYARPEALRNLQNFHLKPIYLLVMADSRWTYGILDVRGSVSVCNNRIDERSMADLLELERLRFAGKDYIPTKLEELQIKLEEKMKDSRVYPKRKYLVGRLHLGKNWYDLPSIRRAGSFRTAGSFIFFEGLLRITVGDKAVKWTMKDVQEAFQQRTEFGEVVLKHQSGLSWDKEEEQLAGKRAKLT